MKKCLLSVWVAACTASMSFAGTFNPKDVAADAKWMVHFDMAKFQGSELGQYLKNNPDARKHRPQMDAFREMFNFDPQNDLGSITLYGTDEQHDHGIVVVQGKMDQPKLIAVMKGLPGYSETQYGSYILFTVQKQMKGHGHAPTGNDSAQDSLQNLPMPKVENGKNVHVCFLDAGKVVIGGDLEKVKNAIAVCQGQAASLDANIVKSAIGAGQWIYMMGKGEIGGMKQVNPRSKCFSQIDSAEMIVGEDGGILKGKAVLAAKTPEAAVQLQNIVQGFVALAAINAEMNPDAALLAQAIKVSLDGKQATLSMEFPVKDLIGMIEKKIQMHMKAVQDHKNNLEDKTGDDKAPDQPCPL